jgi:glycosyltransferase involved in cell wall biosynthesis
MVLPIMADQAVLPQEARDRLSTVDAADIVVGIPSYNNASTIGYVVRMAQAGLHRYFGNHRSLILNSDGGSSDGTPQAVTEASLDDSEVVNFPHPVSPVQKLSMPYHGIPGKGSAFRMIFEICRRVGAKTLIVLDSDLRSITPDWIYILAKPILEDGFDFVAPYYTRHKFDGTITNSIVYPLTRALYGKRIRQPIGGDFAFSAPLIARFLTQDVWNTDVARFGIDIWVTTQAVCGGYKVCQGFLGAKIHDPKDPASDLSSMLVQVVGSLFQELERNVSVWQKVRGSDKVPVFGDTRPVTTEPVTVNVNRMIDSFRVGYDNLRDVWAGFLTPAALLDLKKIHSNKDDFVFPDTAWVRIVYDFALAFHLRTISRDHLLRALTPLYLGWVASFVLQMHDAGPDEVEQRLESLCTTYEDMKPYLISRWRWPDRFNP